MGIVLGFLLPNVFIHLRPFVPWLFGIITLAGALRLRVAEFGGTLREPLPILAYFVSSHVIMPVCAFIAASFFFGHLPDIVAGYVLVFSAPTAVSVFIWIIIFRGDKAFGLTLILLTTMLSPLLIPGTVSILVGAKVAMNMGSIVVFLVLMVAIPTIIGVTLNEASQGKVPAMICPYLDPVGKIGLMLVIAANASPVALTIRLDDPKILGFALLSFLLAVSGFLLARLAALVSRCSPEKSAAMLFTGGMRNVSTVATIAISFFPEPAVIPALFGILFQHGIAALMGKLLVAKGRGS
jgi:tagaturonate reductase